jgi:hypothetical protein
MGLGQRLGSGNKPVRPYVKAGKRSRKMVLKAKAPKVEEKRLKMFVFGPAGIGKTTAAIQFPNSYVIDTEKGSNWYAPTINKAGSVVLQTNNPDEIRDELKALLTEKHGYKTLIIDPITQVYNAIQDKWTKIFEKYAKDTKDKEVQDFGMRYWSKVKSEFKAIQRLMLALDMNVIITSHQKDVYGPNFSKVGVTFDSMRGDDYLFDLIFRLEKVGNKRMAITVKERADMGKNKFPEQFEWGYENFLKFYGAEIIEREAKPVEMATAEQVARVKKLVETLNVDDEEQNRWFTRANVEKFEEMDGEHIGKVLEFLEKKLAGLTKNEPKKESK